MLGVGALGGQPHAADDSLPEPRAEHGCVAAPSEALLWRKLSSRGSRTQGPCKLCGGAIRARLRAGQPIIQSREPDPRTAQAVRRRQAGAAARSRLFKGAGPKDRADCAAAPGGCCGAQPIIQGSRTQEPSRLRGGGAAGGPREARVRRGEHSACGPDQSDLRCRRGSPEAIGKRPVVADAERTASNEL